MSRPGVVVGGVLVLVGVLFGLQGLGVVGGSAMSGQTLWAVLGPLIAVAGAVLLVRSARAGNGKPPGDT